MKLHAYHYQCPHEAPRMWTLEIPDSRAAVKSNFILMKVHAEVFHEDLLHGPSRYLMTWTAWFEKTKYRTVNCGKFLWLQLLKFVIILTF